MPFVSGHKAVRRSNWTGCNQFSDWELLCFVMLFKLRARAGQGVFQAGEERSSLANKSRRNQFQDNNVSKHGD